MSCYVCLQPTQECSPCRCAAFLHVSCRGQLNYQGFSSCGVCRDNIDSLSFLHVAVPFYFRRGCRNSARMQKIEFVRTTVYVYLLSHWCSLLSLCIAWTVVYLCVHSRNDRKL